MKPVLFALVAMLCYSCTSVLVERKLANVSPLVSMVIFCSGLLVCVLPIVLLRQKIGLNFTMPQGSQYWFFVLCGILFFVADFSWFSAYHSGGSVIVVNTIAVLLPVAASLIKFAGGGAFPSSVQLVGWAFAVVAVFLVTKG